MDMYKLKFTVLQMEIFRLFCMKTGEKINQRQIAGLLGVSPTAVARALPILEKEKLVRISRGTTKLHFVELNRDSQKALELKRVENLRLLLESGLPSYLEEHLPGCTIILFGSYERGDDTVKSDIDIAVVGAGDKKLDVAEYEKRLEKEIRINYYKTLKDINRYLKSNILNGFTLSGGIEL